AAVLLALLMPSVDLFGREKAETKREAERKTIEHQADKLEKQMKNLKEKLKGSSGEVAKVLDDLQKLAADLKESSDGGKKEALRRLDKIEERIHDLEQ